MSNSNLTDSPPGAISYWGSNMTWMIRYKFLITLCRQLYGSCITGWIVYFSLFKHALRFQVFIKLNHGLRTGSSTTIKLYLSPGLLDVDQGRLGWFEGES